MSAKRVFRRIDINATLQKLLNAPEIPEAERELSREEALKIMTEGFRSLLNQGYSVRGIVEYLKKTDCPIKDIKQGEIASLLQSEEKTGTAKRKYQRTEKTEAGNMPELKKEDQTQRGDKKEKTQQGNTEAVNVEKGLFSLTDELPLDKL